MSHKTIEDGAQKLVQTLVGAVLWVCGKWIMTFIKWIVRKYDEERKRPLVIYMRRFTVYLLIAGALTSALLSAATVIYLASQLPTENGMTVLLESRDAEKNRADSLQIVVNNLLAKK